MGEEGRIRWIGIVVGAIALLVGLVLSGVTLFLIVPLIVVAVPVLYATWRIRRQRLLDEEDRNERELGVRKTCDRVLVETVSVRRPAEPARADQEHERQTFDNPRKV
jgi:hypothetical protein